MLWIEIFLIGLVLSLFSFWIFSFEPKNFPRGPVGLPVVGYLPFLGKHPFLTLTKLGEKYGGVFSVRLGTTRVVVLNDWPAIKEALIHQAESFNGRPRNIIYDEIFCNADIAFAEGPDWRQRRRFALQNLRNFGVGKIAIESTIMEEIRKSKEKLKSTPEIQINNYFFVSFLNIIWSVVGGRCFDDDDINDNKFVTNLAMISNQINCTNPLFFLPFLRHFVPSDYKIMLESVKAISEFIRHMVSEHKLTFEEGHLRDLIDAGLERIRLETHCMKQSVRLTHEIVTQISHDLFLAGVGTSNSTVTWGLLCLATWPSIQQKVQEELDEVIGRSRLPNYNDRMVLKYTNAVIMEIHRYTSILSLSLQHRTMSNTHLFGFTIPKGTIVIPNLWACHHDPHYWNDPDVFRPERFLDELGEVHKPEYLIPFSVGGRICLGKSLAEMNVFLFFTCLLQQFSFSLIPGVKPPSFESIYALVLEPEPFSLRVQQR